MAQFVFLFCQILTTEASLYLEEEKMDGTYAKTAITDAQNVLARGNQAENIQMKARYRVAMGFAKLNRFEDVKKILKECRETHPGQEASEYWEDVEGAVRKRKNKKYEPPKDQKELQGTNHNIIFKFE